jgi:hypothetical protein
MSRNATETSSHRGKLCYPLLLSLCSLTALTQCDTGIFHSQASKIIFFNNGPAHQLGVHFGALFGLVGVKVVGLSIAIWFDRWRSDKNARQEIRKEKMENEE